MKVLLHHCFSAKVHKVLWTNENTVEWWCHRYSNVIIMCWWSGSHTCVLHTDVIILDSILPFAFNTLIWARFEWYQLVSQVKSHNIRPKECWYYSWAIKLMWGGKEDVLLWGWILLWRGRHSQLLRYTLTSLLSLSKDVMESFLTVGSQLFLCGPGGGCIPMSSGADPPLNRDAPLMSMTANGP